MAEIRQRDRRDDYPTVPGGEQLGVDTYMSEAICRRVTERPVEAIVSKMDALVSPEE